MKKRYYTSFSKRLVLYLVSLLLITGSLVFISIFTFSREFITDNALYQANTIATNVSRSFERKIKDIESIPNTNHRTVRKYRHIGNASASFQNSDSLPISVRLLSALLFFRTQ